MSRVSLVLVLIALVACSDAQSAAAPGADAGLDAALRDGESPDAAQVRPDAAAAGLGEMTMPRSLMAALTGPDKRVRVFGGLGVSVTNSAERYDATTNTWSEIAPSTSRRYGHAAGVDAAGVVYVLGGTADGRTPLATAGAYDPNTDTWSDLPPLPEARLGLGVAAVGSKVLVLGGRGPGGGASATTLVYTPASRTWTEAAPMPTPRLAFATVVLGNNVYAIGGRDATDAPLGAVEVYDPSTDTWSIGAPLSVPRYWLGAAAGADGRIYAVGGISDLGFDDAVESMLPGEPWRNMAPLPAPRAWLSCATAPDGRVLAIGGATAAGSQPSAPLATMLAYDPSSNKWSSKAP